MVRLKLFDNVFRITPSNAADLPAWTWIVPFFVCHSGTWLSLYFRTDPGTALWYLPTAMGVTMALWWGPRVMLGVYLNAVLCASLWDLPWQGSPLYALPETLQVGLSWLLFSRVMQGKSWIPDFETLVYLFIFASVIPVVSTNAYLVTQLLVLGDIPSSAYWNNFYILVMADLASHVAFAIPALVFLTQPLGRRGWARVQTLDAPLPLLAPNRRSMLDAILIGAIILGILILGSLFPVQELWFLYGLLMLILAVRYGFAVSTLGATLTVVATVIIPFIAENHFGAGTAEFEDVFSINFNILLLCSVSLITGRVISDLSLEIDQRQVVEEALRASKTRYRDLFESSPLALFEQDFSAVKATLDELRASGVTEFDAFFDQHPGAVRYCADRVTMVSVNQAACALYEAQTKEAFCGSLGRLFAEETFVHFRAELIALAGGATRFEYETVNQTLTGKRIQCVVSVSIAAGSETTWRRVIVSVIDITERKRLEAESRNAEILRVELEKEKEIVALKNRFISTVSHEFRTPLAVIRTASDILQRYFMRITAERRDHLLQQIDNEVIRMADLIDDTLMVSEAQAKTPAFEPVPVNLDAFCRDIMAHMQFADMGDHEFTFVSPSSNGTVMLDRHLLHHILTNLLSNAVKYSPEKSTIEVQVAYGADNVMLLVCDEGIGIPEDDQKHLFEPFHRASNVGTIQGTGLGLSIVKEYVGLHGGSIEVISEEGKGSVFRVLLPV